MTWPPPAGPRWPSCSNWHDIKQDATYLCALPAGHEGPHYSSGLSWYSVHSERAL